MGDVNELLERAAQLFGDGDYEGALGQFRAALALVGPESTHVIQSNIGAALMSLGRIEEAIQAFDAALASAPDHFESLHNKGVALSALERYEEALKCFEAAAEKMPTFYAAHAGKSESLAHLDRFEESIAAAEAAIAVDGSNFTGYNDKGFAHLRLAQYKESIASYQKAIELGDDSAETRRLLGVALQAQAIVSEEKGNLKEALELMTQSLALQRSATVFHNCAIVLVKMDNLPEAIKSLVLAVECDPLHFESQALLGALYSQAGDNEKALAHLESALRIKSDALGARYNLGSVKIKLGDAQGAKSEWEKILETDPTEPNATEALRILNEAIRKVTEEGKASAEAVDITEATPSEGELTKIAEEKKAEVSEVSSESVSAAIAATAAEEMEKIEKVSPFKDTASAAANKTPPAAPKEGSKKPPLSASKAPTNDIQRSFVRDLSSAAPAKRGSITAAAHIDLDKHSETIRRASVTRKFEDSAAKKFSLKDLQSGSAKGVDPTKKEQYLADDEFARTFQMTRAEFDSLPLWKRERLKKNAKLF